MEGIAEAMANIDKPNVLRLVDEELKRGTDPLTVIAELREGLEAVGNKYERGDYFLFDLIFSGEIFKDAAALLAPKIKDGRSAMIRKARVMIGTVKGDIHDIGKNIVTTLLDSRGFETMDLGVDVPPETFVQEARDFKPAVVGMSGLLTASIDFMNDTIAALANAGLRTSTKVIVGGGIVGDQWTQGKVTADATTRSAVEGVNIIETFTA